MSQSLWSVYLWVCVCFLGFQCHCVPLSVLAECCTVSLVFSSLLSLCLHLCLYGLVSVLHAYVNRCPNACRLQYLLTQFLRQCVCTFQCVENQICLSWYLCFQVSVSQILHISFLFAPLICPSVCMSQNYFLVFWCALVYLCLFLYVPMIVCFNDYMSQCLYGMFQFLNTQFVCSFIWVPQCLYFATFILILVCPSICWSWFLSASIFVS